MYIGQMVSDKQGKKRSRKGDDKPIKTSSVTTRDPQGRKENDKQENVGTEKMQNSRPSSNSVGKEQEVCTNVSVQSSRGRITHSINSAGKKSP